MDSKVTISLYNKTPNSKRVMDKQISEKCLELWDIMLKR